MWRVAIVLVALSSADAASSARWLGGACWTLFGGLGLPTVATEGPGPDAFPDVSDLDVEDSAGLGRGWGCCNCADCFPGTGGCHHNETGCCPHEQPLCCNVGLWPERHRDFCRQAFDTSTRAAKQLRCEVCAHAADQAAALLAKSAVRLDEDGILELLGDICQGPRRDRPDRKRWGHLDGDTARIEGLKDEVAHGGQGSLHAQLLGEGWEVVESSPGKYALKFDPELAKLGCAKDGVSFRSCAHCSTDRDCDKANCRWKPGSGGGCRRWPRKGEPAYSNFSSRDSLSLACRGVVDEHASELAEFIFTQTRKLEKQGGRLEAPAIRDALCFRMSRACASGKRRRSSGGGGDL